MLWTMKLLSKNKEDIILVLFYYYDYNLQETSRKHAECNNVFTSFFKLSNIIYSLMLQYTLYSNLTKGSQWNLQMLTHSIHTVSAAGMSCWKKHEIFQSSRLCKRLEPCLQTWIAWSTNMLDECYVQNCNWFEDTIHTTFQKKKKSKSAALIDRKNFSETHLCSFMIWLLFFIKLCTCYYVE